MEKSAKFIIDVSAETKRIFDSSVRFFSKDHRTAKFLIQAEKDKVSIPKDSISRVEILFESVDISYTPTGKVIFNDDMTIEENGLFSYVLPDELLNYSGLMAFEVYIYYVNEEAADSSNRIIYEQRVSAIDRVAGQVELVYIKDMEDAKQAVADKADEVMADMSGYESSSADYEHQIKDGMDQLYDSVAKVSTDEITKIQAVLSDVQATAVDETDKIKARLPIVEDVAVAETEKIQAELPKVAAVTTDEISKIKSELPKVQTVATEEIGKIRDVLSTVEQTAQEVSDHADQKIAEYDAKFVSADQKMTELEQSQSELDAELKVTQQQIIDADVYTKAEADANAEGILDKRNLSPAWSWSKDGTDRFTTVYPGENLLLNTSDFTSVEKWGASDGTTISVEDGCLSVYKSTASSYRGVAQTIPVPEGAHGKRFRLSTTAKGAPDNTALGNGVIIHYLNGSGIASQQSVYGAPNLTTEFQHLKYTYATVPEDTSITKIFVIFKYDNKGTVCHVLHKNFKLAFEDSTSIYTPAPSEDPLNAYPIYKGLRLAPSDNPADYDWSYTDEYVDYLKNSSVSKTEFNDLASRFAAFENQGGI